MEIDLLSHTFDVRRLGEEDIDLIYDLSCKNEIFYQYHPPFVTRESIRKDMHALPPNKEHKDKYYVGFFENEVLVSIMDFILGYPEKKSGLKKASGIGSMVSTLSRYLARFSSPFANRNSKKVIGSICIKLTFPTGKEDGLAQAIPNREPAQAM
jgi:hypothetical protein